SVRFYPRHWLSKGRWPEHLRRPAVRAERDTVAVSRQDLFDMAKTVTSADTAVNFYVHVAGWGVGTKARGAARVAMPLQDRSVGDKLRGALDLARAGDPVQAYAAMDQRGA